MHQTRKPRRGVIILPNLVTTASIFCGFLGIVFAIGGRFEPAAIAILASALFDGLDGRIARLTGSTSDFGVQYDSLADLMAFGVTPAVVLYAWTLSNFPRAGLIACFMLVACGALRLARFNVQAANGASSSYFTGLPIPAVGCSIATLILFSRHLSPHFVEAFLPQASLVLAVAMALLMVSRVRYASFKKSSFAREHRVGVFMTLTLILALLAIRPTELGFLAFFLYVLSGPVAAIVKHRRHEDEEETELVHEQY